MFKFPIYCMHNYSTQYYINPKHVLREKTLSLNIVTLIDGLFTIKKDDLLLEIGNNKSLH